MNDQEFIIAKQKAIERMKEFNGRSSKYSNTFIPPIPDFVSLNGKSNEKTANKSEKSGFNLNFEGLNIPFLEMAKNDKDVGLILGLILLLVCENSDKLTLIALLYILL
ncbi:MAG: hypothetical protein MJ080_05885 [Clostridia bacterium]|nr:hypothetical protein [Clostridia bacterium]